MHEKYRTYKNILHKSFTRVNRLILGQRVVVDKQEISNSMNEHFGNIGNKLQSGIPDYGHKYRDYMPQRINNSFYLQPITTDDILLEIKRLKHNKSPGHDFIGSKVVKQCPEIFAMNLAKIYNWGIENGKYPDDLKIAKVITLYKKGVKFDPNNYRPISLLSLFEKYLKRYFAGGWFHYLSRIRYCIVTNMGSVSYILLCWR